CITVRLRSQKSLSQDIHQKPFLACSLPAQKQPPPPKINNNDGRHTDAPAGGGKGPAAAQLPPLQEEEGESPTKPRNTSSLVRLASLSNRFLTLLVSLFWSHSGTRKHFL
ncbi:hypothetical protein BC938DRAFT_475097, partial [Jimgerdemannia flammicorona]